jgi:hypothetical protein
MKECLERSYFEIGVSTPKIIIRKMDLETVKGIIP